MSDLNCQVVAIVKTDKEHYSQVADALSYCALESKREPGCLSYNLKQDVKNPLRFVVVELWKNEESLDAHMQKGHFLKLKELISLTGSQVDIIPLKSLDDE